MIWNRAGHIFEETPIWTFDGCDENITEDLDKIIDYHRFKNSQMIVIMTYHISWHISRNTPQISNDEHWFPRSLVQQHLVQRQGEMSPAGWSCGYKGMPQCPFPVPIPQTLVGSIYVHNIHQYSGILYDCTNITELYILLDILYALM